MITFKVPINLSQVVNISPSLIIIVYYIVCSDNLSQADLGPLPEPDGELLVLTDQVELDFKSSTISPEIPTANSYQNEQKSQNSIPVYVDHNARNIDVLDDHQEVQACESDAAMFDLHSKLPKPCGELLDPSALHCEVRKRSSASNHDRLKGRHRHYICSSYVLNVVSWNKC